MQVAKFATNASGAMWLPNLVQVNLVNFGVRCASGNVNLKYTYVDLNSSCQNWYGKVNLILEIKSGSWYFRLDASSSNTELATFPRYFFIRSDLSQIKAIFDESRKKILIKSDLSQIWSNIWWI